MTRITVQPVVAPSAFWSKLPQLAPFRDSLLASYQREEVILHLLVGALMLVMLGLYALNIQYFHFTTLDQLSIKILMGFPILLIIWLFIGYTHRLKWPRFALVATTCANLGLFFVMSVTACAAIITTPFTLIDYHLVQWDRWLGFDVTRFMAWAHQFPYLMKALSFGYGTWVPQVLLAPILLAVLNKSKAVNQYLIANAICMVFWYLIYYFFPTIAPAGVMHSPYFVANQYDLVTRYYEVHQFLPISTFEGGMISFPSGHVMCALLVLLALREVKIVFYPMLVINALLIMATLALGYHYLVDIIASFVIVAFAIAIQRLSQSLATKNSSYKRASGVCGSGCHS